MPKQLPILLDRKATTESVETKRLFDQRLILREEKV